MERRRLTSGEITSVLSGLNGWNEENRSLRKRFKFSNFAESLAFVTKVGGIAEDADHHPDITFGWGYAEIAVTTHDRGGITDVDVSLAQRIDTI